MNALVANALFDLYMDGFVENIYPTLRNILVATIDAIENYNLINIAFQTFAGISAALLIIFFYLDLAEQISRQMFSFEKLMVSFIRLMACVAFCILLPQICSLIMYFAASLLDLVYGNLDDIINNGQHIVELIPDSEGEFEAQLASVFPYATSGANFIRQFRFILEHPVWSIETFVISLLAAIINLVAYFLGIATALIFIVRLFFAPIGVVNIFRGEQSSGIRYFKMLVASACTFVAMLVIVYAAELLGQGLMGVIIDAGFIDEEDLAVVGYYGQEVTLSDNGNWVKTGKTTATDGAYSEAVENFVNENSFFTDYINNGISSSVSNVIPESSAQYITYVSEKDAYYYYPPTLMSIDISEDALDAFDKSKEARTFYEPYFNMAFNFRFVILALIPEVVSIAGMLGASRVMNDVFGA